MTNKLNELIHQPSRLQIMALLYVIEEADMLYLKKKTGMTWGNLSSHLSKLEEVAYVEIMKSVENKKMRTTITLTDKGKSEYDSYRESILELVNGGAIE